MVSRKAYLNIDVESECLDTSRCSDWARHCLDWKNTISTSVWSRRSAMVHFTYQYRRLVRLGRFKFGHLASNTEKNPSQSFANNMDPDKDIMDCCRSPSRQPLSTHGYHPASELPVPLVDVKYMTFSLHSIIFDRSLLSLRENLKCLRGIRGPERTCLKRQLIAGKQALQGASCLGMP